MIWEQLNDEVIFLDLQAKTSDDVFETMGSKMIDLGLVNAKFVQGLKAREIEFPTGINLGEIAIAIPHTDASYVLENGIGFAKLDTPVEFIEMGTEDDIVQAQLVFMLMIKDPSQQVAYLQAVISLIQDTQCLKALMDAKSPQDVVDIVKAKEGK